MTIGAITPTIEQLRARVTEKGPWFAVPADTKAQLCKGCGCMVYFVQQPSGKVMPIDVLVPGGLMPQRSERDLTDSGSGWMTAERVGRGVSHFATCTRSDEFRRTR